MTFQQNKIKAIGYVFTILAFVNILLTVYFFWRFARNKTDFLGYLQAITGVTGLLLQITLILFNVQGKKVTISRIFSIVKENLTFRIISILMFISISCLLFYDLGRSLTIVEEIPFADEEVSLTILQATKVSTEAEITTEFGQTLTFVRQTPSAPEIARGDIRIINTIEQAIPLPEGTLFMGINSQNQEVRFVIDQATTVPPAVTVAVPQGRYTTYGEVLVGVTAIETGTRFNLPENSIKQILIPGFQPLVSDLENILIRHGPLTGGTEQSEYTYLPNENDRQWQLDNTLTKLYEVGLQKLRGQTNQIGEDYRLQYIYPSREDLNSERSYELAYSSPNTDNTITKITVRTRFNALAVPIEHPLNEQLSDVAPQYFAQKQTNQCKGSTDLEVRILNTKWDGERLTVDGVIVCRHH